MQARPANQANQANLYRIAVLIDDLKHEIVETRITSIRSLKEIAVALGEERTREELLPFLDDTSVDDEDEVLMVLAEELGGLTDYIGGVAYISSLLKPLEQLTTVEEPSVREKAIASICFLVEKMSNKDVGEYFVPMIRRLAEKDWYTSRVASCALFAAAYPKVTPEIKAEIRGMFGRLSKDDTILVRKAASQHISKLAKVVEAELMRSELLPIFQKLAKDDQDSVRILAVPNIVEFSQLSITDTQRHEILANVFDLVKDKAWRVRWTVAQGFVDILKQIDKTEGNEELPRYVKLFVRLLRDEEAEVKAAATLKMASVARELKSMPAMVAEEFMPAIKELFEDTCDFVRAALASVIFGMAPVLGKDRTVENLVPFIIGLLKDAESEVRLNLISKLDDIEGVFSVEDIGEALLPSVSELAKDGQWRIRHSIILHVPLVAKHLSIRTFDASLVDLCMIWLHDEVFSIREVATNNLKALAEIYGEAWTKQHVIPKVIEMNASSSYLFRMQALRAVESLSTVISQEIMNTRLIPLVVKMAEDPTANIRFNVAKCFRKIYETLDTAIVEQEVKPCLRTLAQDADRDVKYFAEKTLKRIEGGIADKEVTIKMDIK